MPSVPVRIRRQCIVKIQKCDTDERHKIEVVNSETARGEAWGTSRAGTRIWPWRSVKNMRQFRLLIPLECVIVCLRWNLFLVYNTFYAKINFLHEHAFFMTECPYFSSECHSRIKKWPFFRRKSRKSNKIFLKKCKQIVNFSNELRMLDGKWRKYAICNINPK